jgi:hypothetical protein
VAARKPLVQAAGQLQELATADALLIGASAALGGEKLRVGGTSILDGGVTFPSAGSTSVTFQGATSGTGTVGVSGSTGGLALRATAAGTSSFLDLEGTPSTSTDSAVVRVFRSSPASNANTRIAIYNPNTSQENLSIYADGHINFLANMPAPANSTLAAPSASTLQADGITANTDVNGAALTLAGGKSTGAGTGGSVVLSTSPTGTTGNAQNALVPNLTLAGSRVATFGPPTNATVLPAVVQSPGGAGTNIAGSNFTLRAGAGTGTGAGGVFAIQTALAGSSGSSANSFTTRFSITGAVVAVTGDLGVTGNLAITGDITSVSGTSPFAATAHSHSTFTTGAAGYAPASGGGTTNFLRADGTWAEPPGTGGGGGLTQGQVVALALNNYGIF